MHTLAHIARESKRRHNMYASLQVTHSYLSKIFSNEWSLSQRMNKLLQLNRRGTFQLQQGHPCRWSHVFISDPANNATGVSAMNSTIPSALFLEMSDQMNSYAKYAPMALRICQETIQNDELLITWDGDAMPINLSAVLKSPL